MIRIVPSRQEMETDPEALRRAESELLYRQGLQIDACGTLAELIRVYAEAGVITSRGGAQEFLMGISALVHIHGYEALAIHALADEIQLAQAHQAKGGAK